MLQQTINRWDIHEELQELGFSMKSTYVMTSFVFLFTENILFGT